MSPARRFGPPCSRVLLLLPLLLLPRVWSSDWPQFRGPDGLGVADDKARPPVEFGPDKNVAWVIPVDSGNASPVILGTRIFLTGYSEGILSVTCLDRDTGATRWRRTLTPDAVEEVHRSLGNPASATPVTDGERLYVHFGSLGLIAFSLDGTELWRRPMALTQTEYGASSSPVLAGDHVIQLLDQDGDSHVVGVRRDTGQVAWRVERPEMRRGFGTPLVWRHHGVTDVVLPGTLWLVGCDPASGAERWRVGGLARITCTSPVVGDGLLFAASWTTGGDHGVGHITLPSFDAILTERDTDKDGMLNYEELPPGAAKDRFKHLDGNRNLKVERAEWESMAEIFARVENQAFAVRPDADGRVSAEGVAWRFKRGLPYVASPVCYRGRFYMVKNGGMLTCLDPATGRPVYQEERLGPVGDYYASLLAADGRIHAISQRGVVSVVSAGDTFEVLARNDLGEPVHASPAAVGRHLYIRTARHLYAFQEPDRN